MSVIVALPTRDGAVSTRIAASSIAFALEPIESADAVAPVWRDLTTRAVASFFQSWDWIGPWLACLPPERRPRLVVGRHSGRVVALAVLVIGARWRFGAQRLRVAHLNDSASADERIPTIEYNGPLLDRAVEPSALDHFVRWVLQQPIDELVLPGIAGDSAIDSRLIGRTIEQTAPFIDLAALRTRGLGYLDSRSPNTRQQLRRALRDYARDGAVALRPAETAAEALDFLDRMAVLHQASWIARGRPGSFASAFFRRFHRRLIADGFAGGAVQLLRISAGARDLGYLYNFVKDGRIAAYQSGFAYESTGRAKPGLVSHLLAIEHNQAAGAHRYDFLAGLNQMKQSLATNAEKVSWLTVRRPSFGTMVEERARYLKSRLK